VYTIHYVFWFVQHGSAGIRRLDARRVATPELSLHRRHDTIAALLVIMPGALLLMAWFTLVGVRLLRGEDGTDS
jgi:hypothetical protein